MLIAKPGESVPADLVAEVAGLMAGQPGVAGVRIADSTATSRTEREQIDRRIPS